MNEGIKTFTSGEALEANRRVKLSSGTVVYAGAYDKSIGVTVSKVASGVDVAVKLHGFPGTMKISGSEAITSGAAVYGAASGKVTDTYAGGGELMGTALEAGSADGGAVEILPEKGGSEVLYEILAVSTDLTAAVAAAFSNGSFTIPAGEIRAGDVFDIDATITLPTTDGADTFTGTLKFGTETIIASPLPDAVNADVCKIHARVHVRVAGASGKLYSEGEVMNDALAAGLALPFANAEHSEDLAVACAVAVHGVWSDATGNVAVLQAMTVRRTRK